MKTKTPNGVQFTVKGNQDPKVGTCHVTITSVLTEGSISGELEGKYTDGGICLTQGWTTLNALNTKIELDNQIARGVKLELGTTFLPSTASKNAKVGIHYRQQALHTRAFLDLFKGPTFTADAVFSHEGFILGGDIGYDVMDGRITKYAAAVGYAQSEYSATVQAHNNFKTFSASYHHRVSSLLEVQPNNNRCSGVDFRLLARLLSIPKQLLVVLRLKSLRNTSSTKILSSRFAPQSDTFSYIILGQD